MTSSGTRNTSNTLTPTPRAHQPSPNLPLTHTILQVVPTPSQATSQATRHCTSPVQLVSFNARKNTILYPLRPLQITRRITPLQPDSMRRTPPYTTYALFRQTTHQIPHLTTRETRSIAHGTSIPPLVRPTEAKTYSQIAGKHSSSLPPWYGAQPQHRAVLGWVGPPSGTPPTSQP